MTAYPPKAMAAVCIVMEAERKTYRKMVSHLRNNRDTIAKIGLRKIPSKSTIARAYGLIPDRYLAEVHRRVICEISAGSVAGDSTGYSNSSFVRWYVVRIDSVNPFQPALFNLGSFSSICTNWGGVCTYLVQILVPPLLGIVAAACVCDPDRQAATLAQARAWAGWPLPRVPCLPE